MREAARHGTVVVYEAVQVDLERPVTLTLLAPGDLRAGRFRAGAWPDHPQVASLYAAGPHEDGFFFATQFVPGAITMRDRIVHGADPTRWIASVRAALAATDTVHGGLDDPTSLLVDRDGRVYLTGFGLAAPDATAAGDERALAAYEQVTRPGRRSRRPWAVGVAVVLASAAAIAIAAQTRDGGAPRAAVIEPGASTVVLGSTVRDGPVRSVDCDGAPPSGSSLACTAMQRDLPGRRLVVPRDGIVVAWHVREARGEVAFRVVRPRGAGRFALTGGSDFETVDGGLRVFRAAVPVRRGDRLGLELAPGSAAGLRAGVRGAAITSFVGPLASEPRPPDRFGYDELMLRVDYVPGKTVELPARLTGAAAAGAPAGRRLADRELVVAGDATVTAAVVALTAAVAVDVFDGPRREARITVPGADPRGRPEVFTAKGDADLTLTWRNPDGEQISTPFRVTAGSIDSSD